ncbi:MAG TPA: T9SS type A sorting domain-containing protein [Flavipsychrobacter sp.]|nr:T9SS type A sorting domain-containing protein [Flavipsychrobacter sp.]
MKKTTGNVDGSARLYPNPATNKIFLTNTQGAYTYNLIGIKLAEGNFSENNGADISKLAAGMYLLKAAGNTYKFTKQ